MRRLDGVCYAMLSRRASEDHRRNRRSRHETSCGSPSGQSGWSDGENPVVQESSIPQAGPSGEAPTPPTGSDYRTDILVNFSNGRPLCIASDPYFRVFKNAVERQVRANKLRLVKFDMGCYYCNSTTHNHLPGKYSSEASFDRLIDVSTSARAIAPDVFIVWYWGVGDSPFWGLYGDTVRPNRVSFSRGRVPAGYPVSTIVIQ